jgi:hypothetical protein
MDKKQVTSRSRHRFEVDTSDKACDKFGFKHGDPISVNGKKGTVMGVASAIGEKTPEPEVLWYILDRDNGKATYSFPFEGKVLPA